jgi:transposase
MARYVDYAPEQDWLLPPRVDDELGPDHVVFFLHTVVERLDLRAFEAAYSDDGRRAYPPQMLLKVWLYAYMSEVTSSRRLERRLHEDLGFRFLAGHLKPDHWTLNEFRRRHPRALNDVFTQVVEAAREMGMGRLGRVAIDSTRVAANASPDRSDSLEKLRLERARIRQRIRRWQQRANRDDDEDAGGQARAVADWRRRLEQIPAQLEQLRHKGQTPPQRVSRSDPESRYLRRRGGFCLGYTAEIAVSDDHLVLAQRVHQQRNDAASLGPMTELIEKQSGALPEAVVADSSYHSMPQIRQVEARGVTAYLPDKLLAKELAGGEKVQMNARQRRRHPGLSERRERLRGPTARAQMQRRKAIVEPVFGVLKQQRGMRQFRRRGLTAVQVEWSLATTAYNLTRMFAQRAW